MSRLSSAALAFFLAVLSAQALAQAGLGAYNPANGHTYLISRYALSPQDARLAATEIGGTLAAINDAAEQAFIRQHFAGYRLWIGLSDEGVEGQWTWDTGEPVTYTNWAPGEPNNASGAEDWVELGGDANQRWNDLPASGSTKTIFGLIEIASALPVVTTEIVFDAAHARSYCRVAPGRDVFAARAAAAALGGHLVAISDPLENALLDANFAGRRHWIGLSDETLEGTFLWTVEERPAFWNWLPGQPDDAGGIEDHVCWGAAPNTNAWQDVPSNSWLVAAGIAELPYARKPFQTNSPSAHFSVDGVLTHGTEPVALTRGVGGTITVRVDSNLAGPGCLFDLAIQRRDLVPGGTYVSPDGQILNLDFASSWFWLSTGLESLPGFFSLPAPISPTFPVPPLSAPVSAQALFVDPGAPLGFRLSQACTLNQTAVGTTTLTLLNDDSSVMVLGNAPLFAPDFTFYGTGHTRFWVCSNGRITFDQASNSGTPSVTGASQRRAINAWCDLDPSLGGTVSVSHLLGLIRVEWGLVRYHLAPSIPVTIRMDLDTATGEIAIEGLETLVSGGGNLLLGVSPGGGAFNPGPVSLHGDHAISVPSASMLYAFGPLGAVNAGLTGIRFTPTGGGYAAYPY